MLIHDVSHMTEKIWRCSIFEVEHAITVEPLLSGHPRGIAKWPLNRGGRLMEVCQI